MLRLLIKTNRTCTNTYNSKHLSYPRVQSGCKPCVSCMKHILAEQSRCKAMRGVALLRWMPPASVQEHEKKLFAEMTLMVSEERPQRLCDQLWSPQESRSHLAARGVQFATFMNARSMLARRLVRAYDNKRNCWRPPDMQLRKTLAMLIEDISVAEILP